MARDESSLDACATRDAVSAVDSASEAQAIAFKCPESIVRERPLSTDGAGDRFVLDDEDSASATLGAGDFISNFAELFSAARPAQWRFQRSTQIDLEGGPITIVSLQWEGEGAAILVLRDVATGYCVVNAWELVRGGNGVDMNVAAVHASVDRRFAIAIIENAAHYSHGAGYTPDDDVLIALLITPNRVQMALEETTQSDSPSATWNAPAKVLDTPEGTILVVGEGGRARRFVLDAATMRFRGVGRAPGVKATPDRRH